MASDDKNIKTNPTPKNEAPPKNKSTSGVDPSKAEGGEIAAPLPSAYSRGEGQKPVSKAYKDNWNVIFARKKAGKCRRKTTLIADGLNGAINQIRRTEWHHE